MELKVYKYPCKNCLLTSEKIVSDKSRDIVITGCLSEDRFFECHKSSMNEGEGSVCCKSFYDKHKRDVSPLRLGTHLGLIKFVDLPNNEKLLTFKQMERGT